MQRLEQYSHRSLESIFWIMGLMPLPVRSSHFPDALYLVCSVLLRVFWTLYICYVIGASVGVMQLYISEDNVGLFVGMALFLGNSLTALGMICESVWQRSDYQRLLRLRREADLLLSSRQHHPRSQEMLIKLWLLIGFQVLCDCVRIWANTMYPTNPSHFLTMPMNILKRLHSIKLIIEVVQLNYRVAKLKCALLDLAARNKSSWSDIWRPYTDREYKDLNALRLIYDRLFECYATFSRCFGWGLLASILMSFLDFVCNFYWTFTSAFRKKLVYKYIYNGATTLSLGSLLMALFWYADAGLSNLGLWFFWIGNATLQQTTTDALNGFSVGALIPMVLSLAQLLAHSAILLESFVLQNCYKRILTLQSHIRKELYCTVNLTEIQEKNVILTLGLATPSVAIQFFFAVTVFNHSSSSAVRFWHLLPSVVVLQLRVISFVLEVHQANSYLAKVYTQMKWLGKQNIRRLFKLVMDPEDRHNAWDSTPIVKLLESHEITELANLKNNYSDIYRLFEALNGGYGISLLCISIVFFVDFLCNSYWVLNGLLTNNYGLLTLTQNLVSACNVMLLISSVCWHCQQSLNYSRNIGCLISKLVKPQGNKRYNDMVCEFSLQTLHQRFIITAKDFFSLDLSLLSSMVAAIVTYLVILIQFMYAEKSAKERVSQATQSIMTNSSVINDL